MINANGDPIHFAFPFQRGADNKLVTAVQDSDDHIMSQVNVVVRYPRGFRERRPEFGISEPLFGKIPVDAQRMADEVKANVPDCNLTPDEIGDVATDAHRIVTLEVENNAHAE